MKRRHPIKDSVAWSLSTDSQHFQKLLEPTARRQWPEEILVRLTKRREFRSDPLDLPTLPTNHNMP